MDHDPWFREWLYGYTLIKCTVFVDYNVCMVSKYIESYITELYYFAKLSLDVS